MITSSFATLFCSLASSGTPAHIPFSLPSVEEIVDSFGEAVDAKSIAKRIACAKCIVVKHIRARHHWPRCPVSENAIDFFHEAMYHTDHHALHTCTTGCKYAGNMIKPGCVVLHLACLLACPRTRARSLSSVSLSVSTCRSFFRPCLAPPCLARDLRRIDEQDQGKVT